MSKAMDPDATRKDIEDRRRELTEELLAMRSLVRGALSEQFLKGPQHGKAEPVLHGPYFVLSRSVKGRTHSRRVKRDEVERVRQDVDNYKRFESVCREFAELTERLGELERDEDASTEAVKKKSTSRSRRTRKSGAS